MDKPVVLLSEVSCCQSYSQSSALVKNTVKVDVRATVETQPLSELPSDYLNEGNYPRMLENVIDDQGAQ